MRDKINQANRKAIKPGSGRKLLNPLIELQTQLQTLFLMVSIFLSIGWIKEYKRRHPCKLRVPTVMIPANKWIEGTESDNPIKIKEKIETF
jgi:hypothetical protein